MENDEIELKFSKKEFLPEDTSVYQTDDGTMYYFDYSSRKSLFVISEEKEIYANIPGETIDCLGTFGEGIYFKSGKSTKPWFFKTYKAAFSRTEGITISYLRDALEGEQFHRYGLCSRKKEGKLYVYRLCDDPNSDGIIVNEEHVKDLKLSAIHRRKAIYFKKILPNVHPSVQKIDENVIVVEVPYYSNINASDSTRLIYITNENHDKNIYVLDCETLKFLPSLQLEIHCLGSEIYRIERVAGVRNGAININGSKGKDLYIVTARLPTGYYEDLPTQLEAKAAQKKYEQEKELYDALEREKERLIKIETLMAEIEQLRQKNTQMEEMLRECKVGALQSATKPLKFNEMENLTKPLVCIQLENGILLYFDNVKPFELFVVKDGIRQNADLALLEGEFDCSFKGSIENCAYFRAVRGKVIKFFRASIEIDHIRIEQINEMKTSEISLFNNQPFYFVELAKEWSVFKYEENHNEMEGKKYDISEVNHLSKYERMYHRGILYLFREHSKATVERVNEKVVKVEGPLIDSDVTSFYALPHSDFIYILNSDQNVIIVLYTTNLIVSQINYEPPADSNNHSIVGIHDGTLTMAFDGVWGRHLATTQMP